MIKMAAGFCFAIVSIVFANKKSVLCKQKSIFLKEMTAFLTLCREMIRYSRMEVSNIRRISASKFSSLTFIHDNSYRSCFGYENEVEEFMTQIGSTDLNGQVELCERYYGFFKDEYENSKSELEKESKTYNALGIFGAAAIMVIFI